MTLESMERVCAKIVAGRAQYTHTHTHTHTHITLSIKSKGEMAFKPEVEK